MAKFSRKAKKDCAEWTNILRGENRERLLERMSEFFDEDYYGHMTDQKLRDEILREYLDSAGHFNHLDD